MQMNQTKMSSSTLTTDRRNEIIGMLQCPLPTELDKNKTFLPNASTLLAFLTNRIKEETIHWINSRCHYFDYADNAVAKDMSPGRRLHWPALWRRKPYFPFKWRPLWLAFLGRYNSHVIHSATKRIKYSYYFRVSKFLWELLINSFKMNRTSALPVRGTTSWCPEDHQRSVLCTPLLLVYMMSHGYPQDIRKYIKTIQLDAVQNWVFLIHAIWLHLIGRRISWNQISDQVI